MQKPIVKPSNNSESYVRLSVTKTSAKSMWRWRTVAVVGERKSDWGSSSNNWKDTKRSFVDGFGGGSDEFRSIVVVTLETAWFLWGVNRERNTGVACRFA